MVALEHWLEEEETAKPVEKEVELLWEVIEEEGNHLVEMVETNLEGKVFFFSDVVIFFFGTFLGSQ